MKTGKKKVIIVASAIVCIVAVIVSALLSARKSTDQSGLSAELLRARQYGTVEENDTKVADDSGKTLEGLEFSAFFTRDIDGDGNAERIKGTCKEIGQEDTLYIDLNVSADCYLKDGKIKLEADNFTFKTAIVSDNIVKGDYIGETKEIILNDNLESGSQKTFWGTIDSKISNNINDYTKDCKVILEGTYVKIKDGNENEETKFKKEVELTVDWYGTTSTEVNKYYYNNNNYKSYQNQKYDIETVIDGESAKVKFQVAVSEVSRELILQEQKVEIEIPELNGQPAIDAKSTDDNVTYDYDKDKKILTITRTAVEGEDGNIISTVAKSNLNNIEVTYPLDAYISLNSNTISLNIPVKAYNEGYNNTFEGDKTNEGFTNPYSSEADGIIALAYSKPEGDVWNIYTSVGNRIYEGNQYRYEVSKEVPTNIYNGNVYEDKDDTYTVEWELLTGKNGDTVDNFTLEEAKKDETEGPDEFLNTSESYESMQEYVTTTGIYFSNAKNFLGENGWIELYNAKENSLIQRFTAENWEKYTKESPFDVNLKSIKIVTSKPQNNQVLNVYQIKEIDDGALTKKYDESEFEKLSYIYTYLKGTATTIDEEPLPGAEVTEAKTQALDEAESQALDEVDNKTSIIYASSFANYDVPYSVPKLSVNPEQITNQKTEDVTFRISASSSNILEKKWINGVFLLELPDNIIDLQVKNVKPSDEKVEVKSYNTYKENGKYYIKISTENDEESTFDINVETSVTANPLEPTESPDVKLYAYNENCDNYKQSIKDEHNIDDDGKTEDLVGLAKNTISIIAPSGLLTTEYVTNYNDDSTSQVIAPNVADIDKAGDDRTAKINVSITSNYNGTISDVVILGKLPYQNNKYTITDAELNSDFTANITGEIEVPEKLKDYVTVYYSTKDSPTQEIEKEENGWTLANENKIDWSEIKSYLICLNGYELKTEDNYIFSYNVEVPVETLDYNSASFSHHAVFYNLNTENGKLAIKTEPNKVGIQVVSKYNFKLTKNKKGYENKLVAGATYSVTTKDADKRDITKSATTNEKGELVFTDLYVDREYTLKEISSTEDYVVSEDEVKFKATIDNGGKLTYQKVDGKAEDGKSYGDFKTEPSVTIDENGKSVIEAKVEDESTYTLKINKEDEKGEPLSGVRFSLNGEHKSTVAKTNEDGQLIITGLYPNEQYELQETRADGYYVDKEPRKFTVKRKDDGKGLEIETIDSALQKAEIKDSEEMDQAVVTVNIKNEKIPTYNLKIIKVDEKYKESDKDAETESGADDEESKVIEGALQNAKFMVSNEDSGDINEYTTDKKGEITIPNLCVRAENRADNYITGECIIQETKAPEGYSNNGEKIKITVTKDGSDKLVPKVQKVNDDGTEEGEEKLQTYKSVTVKDDTVILVIQDKPLFKLTKKDSVTGDVLPNAKFEIYELDENGHEVGYAKDVNDNYVGKRYVLEDESEVYIVTTGEDGTISLPLRPGTYKAVEVGYPEGYQEYPSERIFKIAGKEDESEEEEKPEEDEAVIIDSIEDLVAFSEAINGTNEEKKNHYKGHTVKLARNLDFKDEESYETKDQTKLTEMIKKYSTGEGFTPIGKDETNYFTGTFDGQGYEIKNLYINTSNTYAGLFGYVKDGEIKNLGVTGKVEGKDSNKYVGGIVGCINNCNINNCYNTCSITGVSGVAGIVSYIERW